MVDEAVQSTFDPNEAQSVAQPPVAGPSQPDFTNQFNTQLSPEEEAQYQYWVEQHSAEQGRGMENDTVDYDMRGFWKSGDAQAANGHYPDTFKKPNHPTFSDESQYNGATLPDGTKAIGGHWEGDSYIPAPSIDINEFKVSAFQILNDAPDYNTGISKLTELYSQVKDPAARDTLSDYGNALRFKFEQPRPNPLDLIQMMPVKPSQAKGDTVVDRLNNYEQANIEAIKNSTDPDYIAAAPMLISSLQNDVSSMRRDVLSGDPSTITGNIADKFFRFSEAAVGPFAQLVGAPGVDRYLQERTAPESDKGFAGKLASFVGGLAPVGVGVALDQPELVGPGVAGVMEAIGGSGKVSQAIFAAQAAGSARQEYNVAMENTGDQRRAEVSAGLIFAGQLGAQEVIGRLPGPLIDSISAKLAKGALQESAGEVGAAVGKNVLPAQEAGTLLDPIIESLQAQKVTPGHVALSAIAAGSAAGAAQVIGNIANNIALNKDGDITDDVRNTFLAGALLGGVSKGAEALLTNSIVRQHEDLLSKAKDELTGKAAPEEKTTKAAGAQADLFPYVTGDDGTQYKIKDTLTDFQLSPEGYVEAVPRPEATVDSRHEAAIRTNAMAEKWVNGEPLDWQKYITDENGEQVTVPAHADEEVPIEQVLVPASETYKETRGEFDFHLNDESNLSTREQFEAAKNSYPGTSITLKNGERVKLLSAGGDPKTEYGRTVGEITAYDKNDNRIAELGFTTTEDEAGLRQNPSVYVDEAFQRQGLATAMYDLAKNKGGLIPELSQKGQVRTPEGQRFREAYEKRAALAAQQSLVKSKTVIFQSGSEPPENLTDTVYPYNRELSRTGPSRAITYFASKMGAAFQLDRNVMDGAFGAYVPDQGKVRILRSLGADPEKFKSTLAHEVGHFIDHRLTQLFAVNSKLGVAMDRFIGLADLIKRSAPDQGEMIDTFKDAREISMRWRPGWDGSPGSASGKASAQDRYNSYRSMPEEIYADLVSAVLNAPDLVRNDYPRVWDNFEGQLSTNKELGQFWNTLRGFDDNPGAASEFNMQIAKEGRVKENVIRAAEKAQDAQTNSLANRLKRSANLDFTTIFQRLGTERAAANKLEGQARKDAFTNVDLVERKDYLGQFLRVNYQDPLNVWLNKFKQTGLDANEFAHFLWAQNVANSTTRTIQNINEKFPLYLEAAKAIDFALSQTKGVNPTIRKQIFDFDKIKTPEDLSDAFAKMGIIGDTAKMVQVSDFLGTGDPNDPQALKIATGKYNRAVANLNRRSESVPIAELKAQIEKVPDSPLKKAMEDVTQDGAFAVRKYLMNAGGATIYDAKADLAYLQNKLGPEKWKTTQDFAKSFHDILNSGNKVIRESGIFSPQLLDTIGLNQDYYVMANVLRHFEGDDSISASLRRAIGSLSETGNEITSTASKMQKIGARAFMQRSVNAAVALAKLTGHEVEEIPKEYNRNLFDMRNTLSKTDKENSYLISYKEGEPTLNKIDGGKTYERMFQTVRDLPGISTLLELSDAINKVSLTRQLKTSLSPLFVLFNKFYDRQKELLFSNSLATAFPGFGHNLPLIGSKVLSVSDKATRDSIHHYIDTKSQTGKGELVEPLKTIVEKDAALFLLHEAGELGVNSGATFFDGVNELFGGQSKDDTGILEKIGSFNERALGKLGGDWLKRITDFDHLRTKVNGYQIGKRVFGMDDAEAVTFSRENFGVPDTMGGGTAAPLINRMFLFGRAHLNEVRTLAAFFKDNPDIAATQIARRLIMPKLLVLGSVMQPVMRLAFGQETSDIYMQWLSRVPDFEKLSKTILPLGFQDGAGNFHNFMDVRLRDIRPDWKAWYIRLPQSREITSVNKIAWPFIKNAVDGQFTKAIGGAVAGAGSDFASSVQPSIQYLVNLAQITTGYNPTDLYRMKGIFRNDLQEGGSFVQKLGEYGKYAASQQFPLLGLYRPFNPDQPKNIAEEVLATPFVGPLARGVTGVSNYGLIEQSKEGEAARVAEDAEIKFSTAADTQHVLDLVSRVRGQVQAAGGIKKGEVDNQLHADSTALNAWHSRIYLPYREELRQARDKGDPERYDYLLKQLNQSASSLLQRIEPEEKAQ